MNQHSMVRQSLRLERCLKDVERRLFYLVEEIQSARNIHVPEFRWGDWMNEIRSIQSQLTPVHDLAKNAAVECGWVEPQEETVNER